MTNKESDFHKGLERRRFERFTCTVAIASKISYGRSSKYLSAEKSGYPIIPGSERQKTKLVNLSLNGAKLLAKSPIGIDTCLAIRIAGPPNAPSIEAKARVIWCKSAKLESGTRALDQNYVGVTFQDLRWRQRFQLKKIMKSLSKELSLA